MVKEGITKDRIGIKEYQSFVRWSGIRNMYNIETSILEINGQLRFVKKELQGQQIAKVILDGLLITLFIVMTTQ